MWQLMGWCHFHSTLLWPQSERTTWKKAGLESSQRCKSPWSQRGVWSAQLSCCGFILDLGSCKEKKGIFLQGLREFEWRTARLHAPLPDFPLLTRCSPFLWPSCPFYSRSCKTTTKPLFCKKTKRTRFSALFVLWALEVNSDLFWITSFTVTIILLL